MNDREVVRDLHGKVLGSITTDTRGNRIVRDAFGKMLGRYDSNTNTTRDVYGKILYRGDRSNALIPM